MASGAANAREGTRSVGPAAVVAVLPFIDTLPASVRVGAPIRERALVISPRPSPPLLDRRAPQLQAVPASGPAKLEPPGSDPPPAAPGQAGRLPAARVGLAPAAGYAGR